MFNVKKYFRLSISILFIATLLFSSSTLFSNPVYQIQQLKDKAKRGDKRAQYKLGFAYMSGNSIDYNRGKALQWLKKAAAQNYYNAWYRLGEMYYDRVFGIHDYSRSYKWFYKPAIRNHGVSQYKLALLYLNGNGVTQNYSKALIWAARAKNNGVAHAAALVNQIQSKMTTVASSSAVAIRQAPPTTVPKLIPSKPPTIATPPAIKALDISSILSIGKWTINGSPSNYLPSKKTQCVTIRNKIRCTSEVKEIKKSGYTASFRIISLITNFSPDSKFTIRYRNKYTSVVYDKADAGSKTNIQDDDTNDEYVSQAKGPRLGMGSKVFSLQCQAVKSKKINCFKPDDSKLVFTKR